MKLRIPSYSIRNSRLYVYLDNIFEGKLHKEFLKKTVLGVMAAFGIFILTAFGMAIVYMLSFTHPFFDRTWQRMRPDWFDDFSERQSVPAIPTPAQPEPEVDPTPPELVSPPFRGPREIPEAEKLEMFKARFPYLQYNDSIPWFENGSFQDVADALSNLTGAFIGTPPTSSGPVNVTITFSGHGALLTARYAERDARRGCTINFRVYSVTSAGGIIFTKTNATGLPICGTAVAMTINSTTSTISYRIASAQNPNFVSGIAFRPVNLPR